MDDKSREGHKGYDGHKGASLTGPRQEPNLTGPRQEPNLTRPRQEPNLTGPRQTPSLTGPALCVLCFLCVLGVPCVSQLRSPPSPVTFADVTAAAGITFVHTNGAFGKK